MNKKDTFDSWEKFLNPETLKDNLIQASVYIAVFENFKISIIEKIRDFYCISIPPTQVEQDKYKEKVVGLDPKHLLNASCLWLKENNALTEDDLITIDELRLHRNELAHELSAFLSHSDKVIDKNKFCQMLEMINKIDIWWLRNVDPPLDGNLEEIDISEIPDEEIIGGTALFTDLLYRIIYDENSLREIHQGFNKLRKDSGLE